MSNGKSAALIFLHGLGDQGSSWLMHLESILPGHIKCICPTAPVQAVTLNMGMKMNSWFDLRSLNPDAPEDDEGIKSAAKQIHKLIAEQESQGISNDRILVGGFSQGGALAIYSALSYSKQLAGIVALSCWLPLHKTLSDYANGTNKTIPFLQCHGTSDFVVPLAWGLKSRDILKDFMAESCYNFREYPGLGHSTTDAEMDDILDFIKTRLP